MSDDWQLAARVEALEIQVKALLAANTLLTAIMQKAQEMYQPASASSPPPPTPKTESYLRPRIAPEWDQKLQAEPSDTWYPVMHLFQEGESPTGCGRVAYYVTRQISLGERFDPSIMRVERPDGLWESPDVALVPQCSSCLRSIDPRSPAELDFSYARTLPPTPQEAPEALEPRTRKPRVNTRRSRPAQEVRVSQPLTRPGGGSSPGPSDLPPEPTLPAAFTPEAQAEVVDSINRLAKEMGLHG
jgi:hypothetical protein